MPELPDIEVFTRNLNRIFSGKKLLRIKILNGAKLKDKPTEYPKALNGKTLKRVFRSGKEMRFEFSGGRVLGLHLMLTGDVFVFETTNDHHSTIAEFYFKGGPGMALTDRMKNAAIKLDPIDKPGIDAISPQLTYKYLLKIFKRKKAVKKLLTDQHVIRGIGNSYSDEILWEARISPYSIAAAIPKEKIKILPGIIKKLLRNEIKKIETRLQGKVNGEVKDFLRIHTKAKTTSPTGAPIITDQKGMMKTYYTKEQVLYK